MILKILSSKDLPTNNYLEQQSIIMQLGKTGAENINWSYSENKPGAGHSRSQPGTPAQQSRGRKAAARRIGAGNRSPGRHSRVRACAGAAAPARTSVPSPAARLLFQLQAGRADRARAGVTCQRFFSKSSCLFLQETKVFSTSNNLSTPNWNHQKLIQWGN